MFIETMSSEELLQEYKADLPEIQRKTKAFDDSGYLNEYLYKRRKQKQVVVTKSLSTGRGNKYVGVIIYTQAGCGSTKTWEWYSYHVGLMDTSRGKMVLAFFNERNLAVKYTAHFFQRYKERLLANCGWKLRNQLNAADTHEKIVALYIQRNLGSSWIETQSVYKSKTHIFAPVPDGVALMQWDSQYKTMQSNTFVTYEMLDEKQVGMIMEMLEKTCGDEDDKKKRIENYLFNVKN